MPDTLLTISNDAGRDLTRGRCGLMAGGCTILPIRDGSTHVVSDGQEFGCVVITKNDGEINYVANGSLDVTETNRDRNRLSLSIISRFPVEISDKLKANAKKVR